MTNTAPRQSHRFCSHEATAKARAACRKERDAARSARENDRQAYEENTSFNDWFNRAFFGSGTFFGQEAPRAPRPERGAERLDLPEWTKVSYLDDARKAAKRTLARGLMQRAVHEMTPVEEARASRAKAEELRTKYAL